MRALLPFLLGSACQAAPSALHAAYLLPPGAPQPCAVSARVSVENEHNIPPSSGGVHAQVDQERLRAELRVQRGPLRLDLPVALVWGGVLDGPLNAAHRLMNLPALLHEPGGVVAFAQTPAGVDVQRGPAAGLGDVTLTWAPLSPSGAFVFAQLAAPTGTRAQYVSVGAWRTGLGVGMLRPDWTAEVGVTVPLNGAATTLAFLAPQPSVQVRASRTWGAWGVAGEARSSPLGRVGWYSGVTGSVRVTWAGWSFEEDARGPGADVTLAWSGCV